MASSKNLDYNKTSFLNNSNSAFIENMYLKFINKDSDLPESWKNYFLDVGEEVDLVIKEINGPKWSPKKKKINFEDFQKNLDIGEEIDLVVKEINGPTWSPQKKKINLDEIQKSIDNE